MLGVSLGILLAKYMPWVDPESWGPVDWSAHLRGIIVFAFPNAFFIAAVLFAVAVLARNEIVSFVAALVLLAGYRCRRRAHSGYAARNTSRRLLDPFGIRTFDWHKLLDSGREEYAFGRCSQGCCYGTG